MALVNQFYMDLDLKRRFERYVATFRSGDNVELIMSIFDDGKEYDISQATKATIYQKTCSGISLKGEGTFDTINGKRVIRYTLEKLYTIETGFNTMILVLEGGGTEISIQPFSIYINDDLTSTGGSYIELIQDLMKQIEELNAELANTIKLEEKGVANGVATLDENGKIPLEQIPEMFNDFLEHIPQTVYKDKVHGMRINGDGILQHETEPGVWIDTGIKPSENGGGSETGFLKVNISINNSIVTLDYVGDPSVSSQKWSTGDRSSYYFTNNGTSFTGNSFKVTQVGLHTLWYRDSNNNEYTKVFEVTQEQMEERIVNIDINNGVVTIDTNLNATLKKWDSGEKDIPYFQNGGNVFSGDSFEVTEVGTYTVYIKDEYGVESVHQFTVTEEQLGDNITITLVPNPEGQTNEPVNVNVFATVKVGSIVMRKWYPGNRDINFFNSQGTVLDTASFVASYNGLYSAYAKDSLGNEVVKTIDINNINSKYAPIFVETEFYGAHGVNNVEYRIKFPLSDKSVRATYTGYDTSNPDNMPTSTFYDSAGKITPTHVPYIDRTNNNSTVTMTTFDIEDKVVHSLIIKNTIDYNYIIVDNAYVIFLKPKSNDTIYTIPTTIEGLPVRDIGATLFIEDDQNKNIEELIIPSSCNSGGRFASNASNLSKITIQSAQFQFNHIDFALTNNKQGWKVYALNTSDTFIKLRDSGKPVVGY